MRFGGEPMETSLGADFILHDQLIERMREMRDVLLELNSRVIRHDRYIEETFDRAWRMLRMRRILVRVGAATRYFRGTGR